MNETGIERILVPTDMSDFGRLALDYALLFNERLGCTLTLLYADEAIFPMDVFEAPLGYYIENQPETKRLLLDRMRDFIDRCVPQPGIADAMVVQDMPARAIVHTADAIHADMIVMGTHGRHGWRRALLGSVTERVLRDSTRPVLTVTPHLTDPIGRPRITRILCPVNFTDIARLSLEYACSLARAFNAELSILHVAEGIEAPLDKEIDVAFRQWLPPEMQAFCTTREVMANGNAAASVLQNAEDIGADLIVIGAQHKRFSDDTVIGTTTERVTRFARCPVLTAIRKVAAPRRTAKQEEVLVSA